ncbi:hypothetical protein DY969_25945 [Pseudomonas aeruginosa]|uniref:hypothetical protein n=1 Tax=Pseudomonas aeruginosa TaxID=287 RepID=UPI000F81E9CD|nr:hypothetical protein [Pseudomonas aeruginosa]RTU13295.1 hypothetical protein DY969_25945 [Pseudomonas aeruginosa]RTV53065.1 hypothetical protein DY989_21475 [Pseudomonas aeruginosa]HCF5745366.1 hypothetical protein [Pseudomonas aeruginosa]
MSENVVNNRTGFSGKAVALIALATVAGSLGGNWFWSARSNEKPPADLGATSAANGCVALATEQQAKTLLGRLFPESNLINFEPLKLAEGSCLLEVDMEAVKGRKDTRGFVYVLPDGERFLNGPLMDKRSKLGLQVDAAQQPSAEEIRAAIQASAQELAYKSGAIGNANDLRARPPASPGTDLSHEMQNSQPQPVKSIGEYRQEALTTIKSLPQLVTGVGQHDVYALVDPLCSQCSALFKQSEDLTSQYGIRWHWIPVHTSESGWVMSAHLLQMAATNPAQAIADMRSMFNGEWTAAKQEAALHALTPDDYSKSQQALAFLIKYGTSGGQTRTPFVAFLKPNNELELIGGKPLMEDWAALEPAAAPPISSPVESAPSQAKINLPEIPAAQ